MLDNGLEIEENGRLQYVMTFDDFKAFYVVFKDRKADEIAEMAFEIFKMHKNHNCHMTEEQRERDMPL